MSESSPVISIVDDDASYLLAVSRLLRAFGYTVQTFPSAQQFLDQMTDAPGCVIVDLRMDGLNGLDLQSIMAEHSHACPVIFMSGSGDITSSVRAIRQGAEDFLTKDAPKQDLLNAVERALARDVKQRAERVHLHNARARFAALTPREYEVLEHVLRGQLNKQIAADLSISERTVKLHRTALTNKLNVRSVAELTRLVQAARLPDKFSSSPTTG